MKWWKFSAIIYTPFYLLLFSGSVENHEWQGPIFALMWMVCVVIFTIGEVYRERKYR